MNVVRRIAATLVLTVTTTGCSNGSPATNSPLPAAEVTAAVTATAAATETGRSAMAGPSTALIVPAPSLEAARALALRWVASTGELLKMGPIARSELIRQQVAAASAETMTANLNADLAQLASGLPIPATVLRLIETPITVDVSVDAATGDARAHVWSVVVFGAKNLGAPRMVFRTSDLVLIVEAGEWKLAGFTAVDGPTPIVTDSLAADWDSFAVVAAWRPAVAGEG